MKAKFEISFPAGFNVENPRDDNIDVNIELDDGRVYVATFFTIENITRLINKERNENPAEEHYFWATDMVIVREISPEAITIAVSDILERNYHEDAFTRIDNWDGNSESGDQEIYYPDGWE